MLMCALFAHAVPARNVTFTHTQKDGTVITLRLVGDEHMHYYQNVATGQAMRKAADGDYVVIAAEELAAQQEEAASSRAEANKQRIVRLPRMKQPANAGPRKIGKIDSDLKGDKSVLVLLVAFSDLAFSGTQADFNNQFNQHNYSANGHIGSARDYFSDQSYGALNLNFDVYGPITLSNTMAYYGANNNNERGKDIRPQQMVRDALDGINKTTDIDYTKYDWDNDGTVDQVVVIYAGYAEAQGADPNTIWPHQWSIGRSESYRFDGKYVNGYACLSELIGKTGSTRDGIGTFCHEFSHCLGLPDFYDTNYEEDGTANDMSYFDVMASGSYSGENNAVPCGYSAYERWQFGWVTPTELSEPATIEGMKPLNDEGADTYVIYNKKNPNEYFMLENRQSNRWFQYIRQYPLAGHGLLITHCNYDATYWCDNTINAKAGDEHFVFVPANKSYELSVGAMQKAFFPAGATSFEDGSHDAYGGALWTDNADGTKKLGVPITNITESNGLISFDVMGGAPAPEPTPAALYYPHIAKLGQPFAAPAFTTDSNGAQTWTSSNPEVASVDAATGSVTINAVGTTIITVTQAETSSFKQASASYMIKVEE